MYGSHWLLGPGTNAVVRRDVKGSFFAQPVLEAATVPSRRAALGDVMVVTIEGAERLKSDHSDAKFYGHSTASST